VKLYYGNLCTKRIYRSNLTEIECTLALSMKNAADELSYVFDASNNYIEFTGRMINGIIAMGKSPSRYVFSFEHLFDGVLLCIVFCKTTCGSAPLPVDCLDDFFSHKINAQL